MTRPSTRGFTMIELMVSVAIVGLLSAVIISSLTQARARTRDTTRLSDLRQLQTALETYKTQNNLYPITNNEWWGTCAGFGSHDISGANGWVPNLAPTFIAILPVDPNPIPPNNCYVYRSNGVDYHLIAYQTVEVLKGSANPAPRPAPNQNEASFAFYTPGARNW